MALWEGGGGPLLENQLGINIQLHGFIYMIYFLNFWLPLHFEKCMLKSQICWQPQIVISEWLEKDSQGWW